MIANNDVFLSYILGDTASVKMSFFHHIARTKFTASGQQISVELPIPASDFLVRDIEIHAYDKWGSLYGIGFAPRDRFSFQMSNTTTGENFFSRSADVMNFSPLVSEKNRIVPMVIPANSVMKFDIYHEPLTTAPNDQALDFTGGVHFEITLKGAKLFTTKK